MSKDKEAVADLADWVNRNGHHLTAALRSAADRCDDAVQDIARLVPKTHPDYHHARALFNEFGHTTDRYRSMAFELESLLNDVGPDAIEELREKP